MPDTPARAYVWDLPLRLFHWLLALAVAGALITEELGGHWMAWHGRLGSLVLGLIAFRLVWGVLGSPTARFSQFVRGPAAVLAYLRGEWRGIGHNPLGALSVLALLGLVGLQAVTGHFSEDDIAFAGPLAQQVSYDVREVMGEIHEEAGELLIPLILLHIGAIVFYLKVKKRNLVRPMLSGYDTVPEGTEAPARHGGGVIAFLVALIFGVAVAWGFQGEWLAPPTPEIEAPMHDW